MRKFETKIEHLKYQVLLEVAKHAWDETLVENVLDIPKSIIPGKTPTMRCCVYKERAILQERVKLAMGGDRNKKGIIEVIDIACDECPIGGYEVTNTCRGCLAQRCIDACHKSAIVFDNNHQAHIDKNKCINCGNCAKACQYEAIINRKRPCEKACSVKAIEANENAAARINEDKCINCGACISQCPFGAIMDKSFILDAIDYINKANNDHDFKVYALIAPSIINSFNGVNIMQLVSAIKLLGFDEVYEVGLGADMVAYNEAKELNEKQFLMSSCCSAFVDYVNKNFPEYKEYLSTNLSPMATLGKYIKEKDDNCKTIFIGPCTAKKAERLKDEVKKYIDVVLTYEELQALFDSKNIDETSMKESPIINASTYGRSFGKTGGVANAIVEGLKEIASTFECKAEVCNGIDECKVALFKKKNNLLKANFVEGMACVNGCIGGAGINTKYNIKTNNFDKYVKESDTNSIKEAIKKIY